MSWRSSNPRSGPPPPAAPIPSATWSAPWVRPWRAQVKACTLVCRSWSRAVSNRPTPRAVALVPGRRPPRGGRRRRARPPAAAAAALAPPLPRAPVDALTTSDMRQAESCRPITRCDLADGYTNLPGAWPPYPTSAPLPRSRRTCHEMGEQSPPEDRPDRLSLVDPPRHRPPNCTPIQPGRGCSPSVWAGSTSKTTTTGCCSGPASSTTPCMPGRSSTANRCRSDSHRLRRTAGRHRHAGRRADVRRRLASQRHRPPAVARLAQSSDAGFDARTMHRVGGSMDRVTKRVRTNHRRSKSHTSGYPPGWPSRRQHSWTRYRVLT
jgi:hypothetical protein